MPSQRRSACVDITPPAQPRSVAHSSAAYCLRVASQGRVLSRGACCRPHSGGAGGLRAGSRRLRGCCGELRLLVTPPRVIPPLGCLPRALAWVAAPRPGARAHPRIPPRRRLPLVNCVATVAPRPRKGPGRRRRAPLAAGGVRLRRARSGGPADAAHDVVPCGPLRARRRRRSGPSAKPCAQVWHQAKGWRSVGVAAYPGAAPFSAPRVASRKRLRVP